MPLPTTKKELLEAIDDSSIKFLQEYETIPEERSRELSEKDGTSPCDLLAYQIGWAKLLISWEKDEKAGKVPHMPAKGFKWNELGELAQSFYIKNNKKTQKQLISQYKKSVNEIKTLIEKLSTKDVFKSHQREWTGEKWAMVKWIQINTVAPYKSARTKVRRWKKERELL